MHLDQFEAALDALLGELDPIKVQRGLRNALVHLRAARPMIRSAKTGSWQLNGYFEESAKRGSYSKGNDDA